MHYHVILRDIRTKGMVLDSNEKIGLNTKKIPVPISEAFTKCCMFLQASVEDASHWQWNRFEAHSSPSNTVFHCPVKSLNILPLHMKIECKILSQQSGINEQLQVPCGVSLHLYNTDINKFTQIYFYCKTNPQNHLVEGLSSCKVAHKEAAPPSSFKTKLREQLRTANDYTSYLSRFSQQKIHTSVFSFATLLTEFKSTILPHHRRIILFNE